MIGMPSAFALGIFSGKFILYFRDSGTPAGAPLSLFHGWGRKGKRQPNCLYSVLSRPVSVFSSQKMYETRRMIAFPPLFRYTGYVFPF